VGSSRPDPGPHLSCFPISYVLRSNHTALDSRSNALCCPLSQIGNPDTRLVVTVTDIRSTGAWSFFATLFFQSSLSSGFEKGTKRRASPPLTFHMAIVERFRVSGVRSHVDLIKQGRYPSTTAGSCPPLIFTSSQNSQTGEGMSFFLLTF